MLSSLCCRSCISPRANGPQRRRHRPSSYFEGTDYPTSLSQFLDWFGSDADCARYLARLYWPDGFSCPKCDRAAWMVSSSKSGVSAKELQRELGIGYHAAWLLLQKLRLAMVRPGRDQDKLSGDIEVDESYLGGPTPGGKRGRGAEGKVIIAIAVERKGFGKKSKRWKLGRTRIQVVPDVNAKTLLDFVEDTCEPGSTIYTDGLAAYKNLPSRGFTHDANAVSKGSDPAHVVLPAVHRVASLVKRWLLGTHHGGIGAQHVEAHLDEFIFRFNRRKSNARGLLFYRLLQNAVRQEARLRHDRLVAARSGRKAAWPATEVEGEARSEGSRSDESSALTIQAPTIVQPCREAASVPTRTGISWPLSLQVKSSVSS